MVAFCLNALIEIMNNHIGSLKLAILIPVYNAEKTIGETLDSLQAISEGWQYIDKIVICDDCSKDRSPEVVANHPFDRCPVQVIRHEVNRGESMAYTTMIESLSDEVQWFMILHADDLALDNFILRNVQIIGSCDEKVASISSNYWVFDGNGERLAAPERDVILLREGTPENIRTSALVGCWWHISGALINKKLWMDFKGRLPEFPYSGDWHLLLRWQAAGYTVGHSVIATTKYRQCLATSITSSVYPLSRDLRERAQVALSMPTVFKGRIKAIFMGQLLRAGFRRGMKFLLQARFGPAANAFKTVFVYGGKLLVVRGG